MLHIVISNKCKKDLKRAKKRGLDLDEFFAVEYPLNADIATYPKPISALMDGITMGGGVGLSGHAAHRIVTERSRIAMPETGIGYLPDVGGTWLLPRAPGELGTYLGLTGAQIGDSGLAHAVADAREALLGVLGLDELL